MQTTKLITLTDTFNNVIISRHRSIKAAVKAERKHLAAVKRANGRDSFLTYKITGEGVTPEDVIEARIELGE